MQTRFAKRTFKGGDAVSVARNAHKQRRKHPIIGLGGFIAIIAVWDAWQLISQTPKAQTQLLRLLVLGSVLLTVDLWNTKGRWDKKRQRTALWVVVPLSIGWTAFGGLSVIRQRLTHFAGFVVILAALEVCFDIGLGLMLIGVGKEVFGLLGTGRKSGPLVRGARLASLAASIGGGAYACTQNWSELAWLGAMGGASLVLVTLVLTNTTVRELKRNWRLLVGLWNLNGLCRIGFTLNLLAALAMGSVALVGILVVLPVQFWYLSWIPVADIISTITFRLAVVRGVKQVSSDPIGITRLIPQPSRAAS